MAGLVNLIPSIDASEKFVKIEKLKPPTALLLLKFYYFDFNFNVSETKFSNLCVRDIITNAEE